MTNILIIFLNYVILDLKSIAEALMAQVVELVYLKYTMVQERTFQLTLWFISFSQTRKFRLLYKKQTSPRSLSSIGATFNFILFDA